MTFFLRKNSIFRFLGFLVCLTFTAGMSIIPRASYAQEGILGLPQPGAMINLSPEYRPLMLAGLTVHPENPLLMDFILSTGDGRFNASQVQRESERLIKYFLACLTIPENDQWVNLSPYEKQRIIPDDLGQTILGRDMLAQDYILKQLTASLIDPGKNLGKSFWDKVYAQARQEYGTTQIPVDTYNKVWILPQYAKVYEHKNTVFVVKSHFRVMLDEDYLALQKHGAIAGSESLQFSSKTSAGTWAVKQSHTLAHQIIRQIILPALEQEVNTGKNFARLRQIYNSMILAVWFKKNLKEALLNQVYTDKAKINGVNVDDPRIKEKIYRQYLEAYKKGVFNYIKEEAAPDGRKISRKYFSGGLARIDASMIAREGSRQAVPDLKKEGPYVLERAELFPAVPEHSADMAMAAVPEHSADIIMAKAVILSRLEVPPHSIYPERIPVTLELREGDVKVLRNYEIVGIHRDRHEIDVAPADEPVGFGYIRLKAADINNIQAASAANRGKTSLPEEWRLGFDRTEGKGPDKRFLGFRIGPTIHPVRLELHQVSGGNGRPEPVIFAFADNLLVDAYPQRLIDGSPAEIYDTVFNVPAADRVKPLINPAMVGPGGGHAAFPGGIDLNAKHLDLQSAGQKINVTFDPAMAAQFKGEDFSGVNFRILGVVPVDVFPLLGLK